MSISNTLSAVAPETDSMDQGKVQTIVDIADKHVSKTVPERELLAAYLAAHMLTVSQRQGAGGSIASIKEGNLSINYANSVVGGSYMATSYGQEYLRLVQALVITPMNRLV